VTPAERRKEAIETARAVVAAPSTDDGTELRLVSQVLLEAVDEVRALRADVSEWLCVNRHPETPGADGLCPVCGQASGSKAAMELRDVQAQLQSARMNLAAERDRGARLENLTGSELLPDGSLKVRALVKWLRSHAEGHAAKRIAALETALRDSLERIPRTDANAAVRKTARELLEKA